MHYKSNYLRLECGLVLECLPSIHEDLGLILSTAKTKQKKTILCV
jgi:hypothetical protein